MWVTRNFNIIFEMFLNKYAAKTNEYFIILYSNLTIEVIANLFNISSSNLHFNYGYSSIQGAARIYDTFVFLNKASFAKCKN